jgi:hypothetical protein
VAIETSEFEMLPKKNRLLILATLLSVLLPASADTATQDLAMRLVTAMRLDYVALDALRWRIRIKSPTSDNTSACLAKADYKRFTPPIANAVAKGLSVDDMTQLLAFYSAPAGRKFTQAALVEVHKSADPSVTEDYPDLSPEEHDQIASFVKTDPYLRFRALHPYAGAKQLADQLLAECRESDDRSVSTSKP